VLLLHEGVVLSTASGGTARLSARCALTVRRSAQRYRNLQATRPPAPAQELPGSLFPAFLQADTAETHLTTGSGRAAAKKRRSVEFLLAGKSVKHNRHLQRFAAAPYLAALLADSALDGLWRRKGGSLRKELIEAYVVVEALEERVLKQQQRLGAAESAPGGDGPACRCTIGRDSRGVVVDLCSGKGFLSVIIAHEFPKAVVLSVDNNPTIQPATAPNTRFVLSDIMQEAFLTTLREQLAAARTAGAVGASSVAADDDAAPLPSASASPWCVALGVHLCGSLSPRAITLFEACEQLDALVLVPCCLDPRTDGPLKAAARAAGQDPYEAKVEQLAGLLRRSGCGSSEDGTGSIRTTLVAGRSAGHRRIEVSVARDSAMRTNKGGAGSEGSAHCKNAVVVGLRLPDAGSSGSASLTGTGTSEGAVRRGAVAGLKRGRESPSS
jgi:hypothetical protein